MKTAPLSDVAEFINGVAFKPQDWHDSGLPIIRIQNLTDPSKPINLTNRQVDDRYKVRRGDILVSWSATLGVFTWERTEQALVNQHIFRVLPKTARIYPGYLKHILQGALVSMERHLHGATMKHVNRGEFLATEIPVPPLDEQHRIAAILDKADAIRAKRRETLTAFDSLAKSVFYNLFGDPVHNPKAWKVFRFEDQIETMQYGPRFYNESYSTHGIRIVRITDLDEQGHLDFGSMPRMDVSDSDQQKFCLRPGDIVFARTGATVGKLALIRPHDPPCIAGAYFIRIRFKEEVEPDYGAAVLRSPTIQSIIVAGSRQSAQQNFSGPGVRALPLPLPPIELQRQFSVTLAALERRRTLLLEAEAAAEQLFASLQSRAFSGQL